MSEVRHPQAYIMIEGERAKLLSAHVSLARAKSSDSFNVSLALKPPFDEGYWSKAGKLKAEVFISRSDDLGKALIKGEVQSFDIDYARQTVRVHGQDDASKLIDKKLNKKWQEKKSEEVAKEVAQDEGIDANTEGDTLKAGRQHEIDFHLLTDHHSPWTLLHQLADREGKDLFVKDGTLQFLDTDYSEGDVIIKYTAPTMQSYMDGSFIHLHIVKNIKAARPTKVTVSSYHRKKKKNITATKEIGGEGKPVEYKYRHSELSQEQADRMADKRLKKNTQHELSGSVDIPGDESIGVLYKVKLQGTKFDQPYFIRTLSHDFEAGDRPHFRTQIHFNNQKEGRK